MGIDKVKLCGNCQNFVCKSTTHFLGIREGVCSRDNRKTVDLLNCEYWLELVMENENG